jgi:hypothetical protein
MQDRSNTCRIVITSRLQNSVHRAFPWVGGVPAMSPAALCGPPALRSLHVRRASASMPALASTARRHGRNTPFLAPDPQTSRKDHYWMLLVGSGVQHAKSAGTDFDTDLPRAGVDFKRHVGGGRACHDRPRQSDTIGISRGQSWSDWGFVGFANKDVTGLVRDHGLPHSGWRRRRRCCCRGR